MKKNEEPELLSMNQVAQTLEMIHHQLKRSYPQNFTTI